MNKEQTIIKVDLDLDTIQECVELLTERLKFLNDIQMLYKSYIDKIVLIKKSKYSVKIYINKKLINELYLITIQSILGDDWKRTAITLRDYNLNIKNYNRLFDIKRYPNGEYIECMKFDVTYEVLNGDLK